MTNTPIKTTATSRDVYDFLAGVEDDRKRRDSITLIEMMEEISGHKATMWGPSIIGFDSYHYVYDSGHEADMCAIGFSPRKNALVLYIVDESHEQQQEQLAQLGPHKIGKSCLYLKDLSKIDLGILREMMTNSYTKTKQRWPS